MIASDDPFDPLDILHNPLINQSKIFCRIYEIAAMSGACASFQRDGVRFMTLIGKCKAYDPPSPNGMLGTMQISIFLTYEEIEENSVDQLLSILHAANTAIIGRVNAF